MSVSVSVFPVCGIFNRMFSHNLLWCRVWQGMLDGLSQVVMLGEWGDCPPGRTRSRNNPTYTLLYRDRGVTLYCTAIYITALHWSSLHCIEVHCISLQCSAALQCSALNYRAFHYTSLHCTAFHCTTLEGDVLPDGNLPLGTEGLDTDKKVAGKMGATNRTFSPIRINFCLF